ncbi:AAA family ATPase [Jannaschia ovalis]|uniref:AAA domain-containing protein n=1 Tax=Jannaschia ovalis TaxID=3038773 RepID=A0ABY8L8J3_9RHOB|nr:hypothetical protein [Jannaschia sp. GRR-S6-38]WGH77679.1 hypothetical protein P8627_11595 [Jannaschia sp. GRR-S6-38]
MIIHLNGRPGVGKLTIGRRVAERIGGRLLDNHSLYNVAFALTDIGSDLCQQTFEEIRAIAFARILDLPPATPVILTDSLFTDSDRAQTAWDAVLGLARTRGGPYLIVVLDCAQSENERRLRSPERMGKRKPMDGTFLRPDRYDRDPIARGGDRVLRLDTTDLTAAEAADRIVEWIG